MKKIKDFFYNKNDLIIVLLIVALAAFIIYTRVDAIMTYPEEMADKTDVQTEQQDKTESGTEDPSEPEDSGSDSNNDKKSDPAGAKDISIEITGDDTAVTVAEKLEDAGIISSATKFEGYMANEGKEDSLKTGTFTIPEGSSNEEILDIITK